MTDTNEELAISQDKLRRCTESLNLCLEALCRENLTLIVPLREYPSEKWRVSCEHLLTRRGLVWDGKITRLGKLLLAYDSGL